MNVSAVPETIAITTYNSANRLKDAIESALAQNHQNVEIIVSDNASPDNMPALGQLDALLHSPPTRATAAPQPGFTNKSYDVAHIARLR